MCVCTLYSRDKARDKKLPRCSRYIVCSRAIKYHWKKLPFSILFAQRRSTNRAHVYRFFLRARKRRRRWCQKPTRARNRGRGIIRSLARVYIDRKTGVSSDPFCLSATYSGENHRGANFALTTTTLLLRGRGENWIFISPCARAGSLESVREHRGVSLIEGSERLKITRQVRGGERRREMKSWFVAAKFLETFVI